MIDWSTALLNSGYKLREMRREGEQHRREREDEDSAHSGGGWGGGGGLHVSLIEVNMDL